MSTFARASESVFEEANVGIKPRNWKKRTRLTVLGAGVAAAALVAASGPVWANGHDDQHRHRGPVATATPIKHLVVIFDENVSFDHYFGTYPNAANTDGTKFTAAGRFLRLFVQSVALGLGALLAIEGSISSGMIIAA